MGISGLMAFPITPPPLGQGGFGQPVSFVVQTTGSWEELDVTVKKLLAKMQQNPKLTNPDSDLKLNKPELRIEMNRDKIATVGSDVGTVGRTLETMLGGRNVTRFKKGSEQYDVIVQVDDDARRTPERLSNIYRARRRRQHGAAEQPGHRHAKRWRRRSSTTSTSCARRPSAPAWRPAIRRARRCTWMEDALQEVAPGAQYDLAGQSREFRESGSSAMG